MLSSSHWQRPRHPSEAVLWQERTRARSGVTVCLGLGLRVPQCSSASADIQRQPGHSSRTSGACCNRQQGTE